MTIGNDSSERDSMLDRAWREHSPEAPSPALDRAILAAAHRAVGSGPADARQKVAEVTRPQRWWMPLAAAATIGVVAIGILQVTPQEAVDVGQSQMAAPASPPTVAAPELAPRATEAAKKRDGATTTDSLAADAARSVERAGASARDGATPSAAAQRRESRGADEITQAPAADTQNPGATAREHRLSAATAPKGAMLQDKVEAKPKREAVAVAQRQDKLAAPAPQPSRAAAPKPSVDEPVAVKAQVSASAPVDAAADGRKDAANQVVDKRPAMRASDAGGTAAGSRVEADALPAVAPPPPTAGIAMPAPPQGRMAPFARERDAVNDAPRASAQAAPSPAFAKTTAAQEARLRDRARDPDEWIALIRKLRSEGNDIEALRELREFRRIVADAERHLPADLREWLATHTR